MTEIFFFGKITHIFGIRPSIKKGEDSIFEGIFEFEEEKSKKKNRATKGGNERTTERGNDGAREQQIEGATGMILPRPYSKTWLGHTCR